MKTMLYIGIAVAVALALYGIYRAVRTPPKAVIEQELLRRESGNNLPQGMGQHARPQDPSWVNRETHGNMG
jgi:hypothetical protein